MLSCHLLDPVSVSHAVTRPAPARSAWVDAAPLFSRAEGAEGGAAGERKARQPEVTPEAEPYRHGGAMLQ